MKDMDSRDWKILYELDLNARTSLSSLAKKVGLSKEVVNYRLKRLVKNGVITSFFTRVDASLLGLVGFRVFVRFERTTSEVDSQIRKYIIAHPKIGWAVLTYGQ